MKTLLAASFLFSVLAIPAYAQGASCSDFNAMSTGDRMQAVRSFDDDANADDVNDVAQYCADNPSSSIQDAVAMVSEGD